MGEGRVLLFFFLWWGEEKRDFRESLVVSEREKEIKGTEKELSKTNTAQIQAQHPSRAGEHELERQTRRLRGRMAERKSN